ncbi:MAG: hypothetical protein ACJ71K_21725 [Nitrososphaeraceae archaeon]
MYSTEKTISENKVPSLLPCTKMISHTCRFVCKMYDLPCVPFDLKSEAIEAPEAYLMSNDYARDDCAKRLFK